MKIIVDTLPQNKENCIFSAPLFGTSERSCILSCYICNLHEGFNEMECNGLKCITKQDEPWVKSPCETCANKGDHDGECRNCVADSEVISWKKPSHYESKDEPQTEREGE